MTLDDIDVSDGVVVDSIVSTVGPTLGGGAVIVRGITAATSSITVRADHALRLRVSHICHQQDLFVADNAGVLDLTDVNVNNMVSLASVLTVTNEQSSATVEGLVIVDNVITDDDSQVWNGVSLNNGGQGSLSNVTFCNNANVRHFADVNIQSSIEIESATVCEVTGGTAAVSPNRFAFWKQVSLTML